MEKEKDIEKSRKYVFFANVINLILKFKKDNKNKMIEELLQDIGYRKEIINFILNENFKLDRETILEIFKNFGYLNIQYNALMYGRRFISNYYYDNYVVDNRHEYYDFCVDLLHYCEYLDLDIYKILSDNEWS